MFTYPNSILATTGLDAHNEILPVELLQQFCDKHPNGMPIQQQHDLSKPSLGYFKNLRVEPHKHGHALVADIYTEEEIDFTKFGGLSISALYLFHEPKDAELACYLPYPFYNDVEFMRELKDLAGLAVGGHIKKELSIETIGLISTFLVLLVAPEWDAQYKSNVRPKLVNAINLIKKKLWPKEICADLKQKINVKSNEVDIIFIPDRNSNTTGLDPEKIDNGLLTAIKYLESNHRAADRLTLVYYPNRNQYEITNIRFDDGSDENIAP